jgi:hypothetical protein
MDPRPLRWLRMTLPIVNRSSVELQVSKDDRGRRGKGGGYLPGLGRLVFVQRGRLLAPNFLCEQLDR